MTIWQRLTDPLCLKPFACVENGRLHARSSVTQQILALFSYRKDMLVDPEAKTVTVRRRLVWFWHHQWIIPFERIQRIDYGFGDTGEDYFMAAIEFYTVSLVLAGPEETIKLFSFIGEFSEPATLTDVLVYGEDAVNWGSEGGQTTSSKEFVLLLQKFTGKHLV